MIGFSQILLNLTTSDQFDNAVRQAAVIYLKNLINRRWVVLEGENDVALSDQDKVPIRQKIIPAIIHSPDTIKYFLYIK